MLEKSLAKKRKEPVRQEKNKNNHTTEFKLYIANLRACKATQYFLLPSLYLVAEELG